MFISVLYVVTSNLDGDHFSYFLWRSWLWLWLVLLENLVSSGVHPYTQSNAEVHVLSWPWR